LFHFAKSNIAVCVLMVKNKRKQKGTLEAEKSALYQHHNDEKSAICIKALAGLEIESHLLCRQAYHPVPTITSLMVRVVGPRRR
jgi:hypothetical protein